MLTRLVRQAHPARLVSTPPGPSASPDAVQRSLPLSKSGAHSKVLCAIQNGEVAEWLKAHAWKACLGETLTRVRIPPSPPYSQASTSEDPQVLLVAGSGALLNVAS